MNCGITKISADGTSAVCRVNAFEVLGYLVKGFVPTNTLPALRSAADWIFQPVFIVVKILQGNGLRADVPAAERVVVVPADIETVSSFKFGVSTFDLLLPLPTAPDFDSTHRLAEIAGAVMDNFVGCLHQAFAVWKVR